MGFKQVAYRGLETGSRILASHVVRQGNIIFTFTSPLHSTETRVQSITKTERQQLRAIHSHLETHGDAVADVAFEVDNVDAVYNVAVSNGARVVSAPQTITDEHGSVRSAVIRTYGDTSEYTVSSCRSLKHLNDCISSKHIPCSRDTPIQDPFCQATNQSL